MRRQPKFLRVIRPAMRDVVLATAINLKRAVRKHRAAVLDRGALVVFIERDLIGASQVMQRFPIGRERCRE